MRAALLGGTFNPIHIGHLHIAEVVVSEMDYHKVLFVPANIPAHKEMSAGAGTDQRLEMLNRALSPYPEFVVESCEIERGGISFTIDTIRYLKEKYSPESKFGLIIGDDLLDGFHLWKDASCLPREADILIAHRQSESRRSVPFPHRYIDNQILPLSSSMIRKRIQDGKAGRFLIPATVWEYIGANHLYRDA